MEILEQHKKYVKKQINHWNKYLNNLDDKIEIYKTKINI